MMRQKVREGDTLQCALAGSPVDKSAGNGPSRVCFWRIKTRRRQGNRPAHVHFFLSFFSFLNINKYIYFCRYAVLGFCLKRASTCVLGHLSAARVCDRASTRAHTFQRADQSAGLARSSRPRLQGGSRQACAVTRY